MVFKSVAYWVPKYKKDLVDWLVNHYHGKGRTKFEGMKMNRLLAIYHSIRGKEKHWEILEEDF